jgi:hypothetical protein
LGKAVIAAGRHVFQKRATKVIAIVRQAQTGESLEMGCRSGLPVGATGVLISWLNLIAEGHPAAAHRRKARLWRVQPGVSVCRCAGMVKRDSADEYGKWSITLNNIYKVSLTPWDRIVDRSKIPYHINGYDKVEQAPKWCLRIVGSVEAVHPLLPQVVI